jgi:hypothetical protein
LTFLRSTEEDQIYKFKAPSGAFSPPDSEEDEETRIEWLETRLKKMDTVLKIMKFYPENQLRKTKVRWGIDILSITRSGFRKNLTMTEELRPDLKAIREELEAEIEARCWEFWPLTIEAELISDQYSVTLTKAGGTPQEVKVSDEFPQDAVPGKVAREMCDALAEKVD